MNKRRRYLAKRRRADWNRLHILALTSWSRLPTEPANVVITSWDGVASAVFSTLRPIIERQVAEHFYGEA